MRSAEQYMCKEPETFAGLRRNHRSESIGIDTHGSGIVITPTVLGLVVPAEIRREAEVLGKLERRRRVPAVGIRTIPQAIETPGMQVLVAAEYFDFGIILRRQWKRHRNRESK